MRCNQLWNNSNCTTCKFGQGRLDHGLLMCMAGFVLSRLRRMAARVIVCRTWKCIQQGNGGDTRLSHHITCRS